MPTKEGLEKEIASFKGERWKWAWKIVRPRWYGSSCQLMSWFKLYQYTPKKHRTKSTIEGTRDGGRISIGIHVYTSTKIGGINRETYQRSPSVRLRVKVYRSELIGCDHVRCEAVYRSVVVTKDDYDRAVRKAKRDRFSRALLAV